MLLFLKSPKHNLKYGKDSSQRAFAVFSYLGISCDNCNLLSIE